jgi:hypothetical protein
MIIDSFRLSAHRPIGIKKQTKGIKIMETSSGITPVFPMGNNGDFGMNGLGGIFALLILLGIFNGNGFGFGGNGTGAALNADMQRGFDTQNIQAQTRDILGAVNAGTAQTIAASTQNAQNAINAIKDGNANIIREFGNVETALAALTGKQMECCCNTLRAIDSVNYNGAVNTAAINVNTTAQIQKVLDAIMGNRMADMQNQINQLQLAQAMCGVMKYPTTWAYNAGTFPPTTTAAG